MTTTARFWREIPSRYNMIGSKCGNCGREFFPPRPLCPECHRKSLGKMQRHQFSGKGEIVSFSIVHQPPREFQVEVPYVVAIVELAKGVRVTGQVVECVPGDVKIGMKVTPVFRRMHQDGKEGAIHYGYKFAPAVEK